MGESERTGKDNPAPAVTGTVFARLCRDPETLARAFAFNEACDLCAYAESVDRCELEFDGGKACVRGILEFLTSKCVEKADGTICAAERAGGRD